MIHPSTELRFIGPEVGYGVFATEFIPKGTITYVEDELEVRIPEAQFMSYQQPIREVLDKYSYIDSEGVRILSWDFGKYVNHNCDFNSVSTGYGFEIAIRDIQAGEELTDEYAIFNLERPMKCACGSPICRGKISKADFDEMYPKWDQMILEAFKELKKVSQPLWSMVAAKVASDVAAFLRNEAEYKSVYRLRRVPANHESNGRAQ